MLGFEERKKFMHRTAPFAAFFFCILLLLGGTPRLAAQPSGAPQLRLKSGTFDPLAHSSLAAAAPETNATTNSRALFLIQFVGPVQEAWKTNVERAGVRLYGYIPDYAFIARLGDATPEQMQQLPFVRWVGPYQPVYKLDAELADVAPQSDGKQTVDIQTLPDADLPALAQQVEEWGGTILAQSHNELAGYLRAELAPVRFPDVAAADGVLWIAPFLAPSLQNNISGGGIIQANAVRSTLGLYGQGQVVGVADSGLDTGNLSTLHPDVRGRVRKAYCLGRTNPCDWSDPNGHGTHVVGSVLGNGAASGSNTAAHSYNTSLAGVAPEAELVLQSILDNSNGLSGIPTDAGNLLRQAYKDGARIHSNSWGGATACGNSTCSTLAYGGYVATSQQVDYAAWQHKDLLVLFAAGNAGVDRNKDGVVDADSIYQPGTAKNVLTVGASESDRPEFTTTWGESWPNDFATAPVANDRLANNINGMAAFSSRGPTDDGRIKPDLVAPGTAIVSMQSQHPYASAGWGPYNQYYAYNGGTSMSTPLTAGAAATVREWLTRVRLVAQPSAALVKAVLLNGTADMSPGQYGSSATPEVPATRPNTVAGWGRVDLQQSLDPTASGKVWFADSTNGLATGESTQYTVKIGPESSSTSSGPLRLMLAWTDYPGEPSAAKALVNDLDLEVIGPDGTSYRGNQSAYPAGHRCLRSGWDTCNNVEGVIIPQAMPGTYTLVVRGVQVPQGGRQPFALVATGDQARAHYLHSIYVPLSQQ
jgi:hypothetical protein